MALPTLSQLLHCALGMSDTSAVDFEQLHSMLQTMLEYLDLQDKPVPKPGEPLQGVAAVPADIEEIKRKVEENERNISKIMDFCKEFGEDLKTMKAEPSSMAEKIQKIQETIEMANLQDADSLLQDLQSKLLGTVRSTVMELMETGGYNSQDWQHGGGTMYPDYGDGLMVVGRQVKFRKKANPLSRQLDSQSSNNLFSKHKGKAQGTGKGWMQGVTGNPQMAFMAHDKGQNDMRHTGISKGPFHVQRKTPDGSFTTLGMNPGYPRSGYPMQDGYSSIPKVQSTRGYPAAQTFQPTAFNAAEVSRRKLSFSRSSSGYQPLTMQVRGKTVPSSTGARRDPGSRYQNGSPKYCGGEHTSPYPQQPLLPLFPDPNTPGATTLIGTGRYVYLGMGQQHGAPVWGQN